MSVDTQMRMYSSAAQMPLPARRYFFRFAKSGESPATLYSLAPTVPTRPCAHHRASSDACGAHGVSQAD